MTILAAAFDNDLVITEKDVLHFISGRIGKKEEGDKWEHLYHQLLFDAKTEEEREKAAEKGLEGKLSPVKGLTLEKLEELAKKVPLTAKAKEALGRLHEKGVKIIIVSAGFLPIVKALAEANNLPIDHFICSECATTGGKIGEMTYALTPKEKGRRLEELLKKLGIPPSSCFAIGDSISEKYMFELVGKQNSIAFNYKKGLERYASHLLYLEGSVERELSSVAKLILSIG